MPDEVEISLSKEEALVLFEFLSCFYDTGELRFADQAEEKVLSRILGKLESTLVEPFMKEYTTILNQARDKIRDPIA